jgi:hypothetical protein
MNCLLVVTTQLPENALQTASLWAIRLAMLLLVLVLAAEILGKKKTNPAWASLWLLGAILSLCHSLGALIAFHHSSQAEALESTAQQTAELLGFRFGAGLYVNYAFVAIWLFDAILRLSLPIKYEQFPKIYGCFVYSFLIFIAINGAIVFKSGTVRTVGIASLLILLLLLASKYRRSRFGNALKQ